MENEISITLGGLLKVIDSEKPITINLYDENDLLLITFKHPGYECLDDFLCADEITKIVIKNLYTIDITIDTSKNE